MSKVKVEFTKDASGIKKGDVKNLPTRTAKACIDLGVAKLVKETSKK